ncbi:hypothetical protein BDY17DRAFT_104406 [Neohortaea acidophila]|uniref:Uncharacterized protein n=1 Tax=Neohortaea acidophila TaxID=245834 RepID=A0A6A6Q0B0_9PEZI|nr:uncharacterized protein BDY17DRAFT_104406 [Neohortaea acidophila]KAF2485471.1 hypothetical protein BDY17DRAFT_104406 [Neohortaea acidophila]
MTEGECLDTTANGPGPSCLYISEIPGHDAGLYNTCMKTNSVHYTRRPCIFTRLLQYRTPCSTASYGSPQDMLRRQGAAQPSCSSPPHVHSPSSCIRRSSSRLQFRASILDPPTLCEPMSNTHDNRNSHRVPKQQPCPRLSHAVAIAQPPLARAVPATKKEDKQRHACISSLHRLHKRSCRGPEKPGLASD